MSIRGASVIAGVLLLIVLLVGSFGCTAPASTPTVTPTPTPKPATPQANPTQTWTIKFVDSAAGLSGVRGDNEEWWRKEVERRTGNRVKIQWYWAGSLLTTPEIAPGVSKAVVEMGHVSPNNTPALYPLWNFPYYIFQSPASPYVNRDIYWRLYDEIPAMREEFTKNNQMLITTTDLPSYHLWSRKPVGSLADLKGLKTRVSGDAQTKAMAAVGAVPTFVTVADLYSSLEKGTIDAALFPTDSAYRFKLNEVTKNVILLNIFQSHSLYVMNLDFWKSLPLDIQNIISGTGKEHDIRLSYSVSMAEARQLQDWAAKGVKVTSLPKEEMDRWTSMPEVKTIIDNWVQDVEKKGLPGRQVADLYMQYATKGF